MVSSQAFEIDNVLIGVPFLLRAALCVSRARAWKCQATSNGESAPAPVPYADALAEMERRAAAIRAGDARELVWLLEHPPLFTAGTSADPAELTNPLGLPVFEAGRGGRYTYHGPGQRVVYVMLDLEQRGKDIRCFVHSLEQWMIDSLAQLGVNAHRAEGRIGIWVGDGAGRG